MLQKVPILLKFLEMKKKIKNKIMIRIINYKKKMKWQIIKRIKRERIFL